MDAAKVGGKGPVASAVKLVDDAASDSESWRERTRFVHAERAMRFVSRIGSEDSSSSLSMSDSDSSSARSLRASLLIFMTRSSFSFS